jgi:hypothetical protein
MTKFFLALIAIAVATLIGAFVIVASRPQEFLRRLPSLRVAPMHKRTLTPPSDSGEPLGSPAGRLWPGVDYPAISANRGDDSGMIIIVSYSAA